MTDEQERHLARAQAAFRVAADAKYRAGVREHGGNLWEHSPAWLLEQVMEECIDQWMYAFTALEKLREGGDMAHRMVDAEMAVLGEQDQCKEMALERGMA